MFHFPVNCTSIYLPYLVCYILYVHTALQQNVILKYELLNCGPCMMDSFETCIRMRIFFFFISVVLFYFIFFVFSHPVSLVGLQ